MQLTLRKTISTSTWNICLPSVCPIKAIILRVTVCISCCQTKRRVIRKSSVRNCNLQTFIWWLIAFLQLCVGVSCFRQISIDKLTNRSENDDFSRSSICKSVSFLETFQVWRRLTDILLQICCLSRLPLFGYIEVKIDIIVDKIFEQGNFNCEDLLKESYNELNRCLSLRVQNYLNDTSIMSSDFINDFYIETCLRELIIL